MRRPSPHHAQGIQRFRFVQAFCARVPLMGAALVVSCAGNTPPAAAPTRVWSQSEARVVREAATAADGTAATLESEVYSWGSAYFAASGHPCRKLLPESADAAVRLVCEYPDGWSLVPAVNGTAAPSSALFAGGAQ